MGQGGREALTGSIHDALRSVCRARAQLTRSMAERLEVGTSDVEGLEVIQHEGPLTPGQLAASLGLTSGAVTGVVDRLEAAGYVRRERDPMDRRKVLVRTVPARVRRLEAIRAGCLRALGDAFSGLSDDDLFLVLGAVEHAGRALAGEAASLSSRRRGPPTGGEQGGGRG